MPPNRTGPACSKFSVYYWFFAPGITCSTSPFQALAIYHNSAEISTKNKQKNLPTWFCHIKNRDPNRSSNKCVTAFKPWLPSKPWPPPKKCCIGRKQQSHMLLGSGSALTMLAPSASHVHNDTNEKLECLSQRASHQQDTEEGNRDSSSLGKKSSRAGCWWQLWSLGRNAHVPLFPASPCQHTKTGFSPRIFQLLQISVNINVWTIGLAPVSPLLCPVNDL